MPPKKKGAAAAAPLLEEDVSMTDAAAPEAHAEPDADIPNESSFMGRQRDVNNPATPPDSEQRVRILPGSSEKAASFEFQKEDHTLGNALRWIIMKNPDVEFCGYSIPHPSEALMNIRIQTYEGTAVDALDKGLADLIDLSEIVADEFTRARAEFVDTSSSTK